MCMSVRACVSVREKKNGKERQEERKKESERGSDRELVESVRATKVSEGENSHTKITRTQHGDKRPTVWRGSRNTYRSVHKGKITHSRYFGCRTMKKKSRAK